MHKTVIPALLGAAFSIALAGSAQALNARTWISGRGADQAGCGPVASPCRTLQYAHDNTSAGGEIDVLDPAGYGSVFINKSINVINEGVGVAGVLASNGNDGIAVSAQAGDIIVLRGLTIEGASAGVNGVSFSSGASLTIMNCTTQNFTGDGIALTPVTNAHIVVQNTTAFNNGGNGLRYAPPAASTATGVLDVDHFYAFNNGSEGLDLNITGATRTSLKARISESIFSQNDVGVAAGAQGNALVLGLDHIYISNNRYNGLLVIGSGTKAYLGKSEIIGNDSGLDIVTGATLFTYNDNRVEANKTIQVDGPVTVMTFR